MTITAGNVSSSFDVDIIDNMIQDGDKMFTITITRLISSCLTLPATVDSIDIDMWRIYIIITTSYRISELPIMQLLWLDMSVGHHNADVIQSH